MRNWFIVFSEFFVNASVGLIAILYGDILTRGFADLFPILTIKVALVIFSLGFAKKLRDEADKRI